MEIIIDGYNLILSGGITKKALKTGIRQAKSLLMEILARHGNSTGHRITVVLDGGKDAGPYTARSSLGPLEIVHTAKGLTADRWIVDYVQRPGFEGIVVSSDREIADEAKKAGVETLSVQNYEKELLKGLRPLKGKSGPALGGAGFKKAES